MIQELQFHQELEKMNLDAQEKFILQMHYSIIELSIKNNLDPYKKYLQIMKKIQ